MINEYIIDFERINKLTVHQNDNPNTASNAYGGPQYCYKYNKSNN